MTVSTSAQPMYTNGLLDQAAGGLLRPGGMHLTERMLSCCDLPVQARILDLGCGSGSTAAYLLDAGFRAAGVDHSAQLLQAGRQRQPELPLVCARAAALPVASETMDAVLAECSLSAISGRDDVLRECWRVLRFGGKLAVSDIYARNPEGVPALRRLPLSCGLREAISKDELILHLEAHAFDMLAWEDHSEALKHLAAQLILSHGSLGNFLSCSEPAADPLDIQIAFGKARLGYYLLVAQKKTDLSEDVHEKTLRGHGWTLASKREFCSGNHTR